MKQSNKITLIVLITFVIMMVGSLIMGMDEVRLFIGDTRCNILDNHNGNSYYAEHWHFSWTHWLYIIMGGTLALIQIFNIIKTMEE